MLRDAPIGPLSFRIGLISVQEPIWSNELTIHIGPDAEPCPSKNAGPQRLPQLELRGEVVGIEEVDAQWFIVKARDRYGFMASLWAARERFAPEEFRVGRQMKATFLIGPAPFQPDPKIHRRYLQAVTFVAQ